MKNKKTYVFNFSQGELKILLELVEEEQDRIILDKNKYPEQKFIAYMEFYHLLKAKLKLCPILNENEIKHLQELVRNEKNYILSNSYLFSNDIYGQVTFYERMIKRLAVI